MKHSDYIPDKYLPTFNSRTIELNFDKIVGLSECFVYFNDDTYLNAPTKPEDFFVDGLPCDCNAETLFINPWYDHINRFGVKIAHFCNMGVINSHFDRRETVREAPWKWYGPHLWGKSFVSSLLQIGLENFEFFRWRHWEQPILKSVIQELWEKEPELMDESCTRFRKDVSLNPYIFRYWQFASNRFHPVKMNMGAIFPIKQIQTICEALTKGKLRSVCINDGPYCTDEEAVQIECELREVFERKFPRKSMFEL